MRTIAVGRILGYRFGSSTSFKLQQVDKRWTNYLCHLFLHAISFLACPLNPFFATFGRSVRANDCCWQNPWLPVWLIHLHYVATSGEKMVQSSLPLVFTRNSVPGVPRKSFLRGVCALGSCERLLFAESLVTGSAHPPPLSCNKWRNNGPIIFFHLF